MRATDERALPRSKGTEKVIEPTVQEFLDSYFLTWQCGFYSTVVLVSTWAVYSIKEEKGKQFVIVYAGLCSLIASWTVLGCKAFMAWVRLTFEKGENQFGNFPLGFIPLLTLGMIIGCAVWSLHYLQQAMRYHDNNKVIPTYYATFTLGASATPAPPRPPTLRPRPRPHKHTHSL